MHAVIKRCHIAALSTKQCVRVCQIADVDGSM